MVKWMAEPAVKDSLDKCREHNLKHLSHELHMALHRLVALAGQWSSRACPAYESDALCKARRLLLPLNKLQAMVSGCWPRPWQLIIDKLRDLVEDAHQIRACARDGRI